MLRCLGQPFFASSLGEGRILRRWSLCRRGVSLATTHFVVSGKATLWSGCPHCSTHLLATPIRTGSGVGFALIPVMAGQFLICGAIQLFLLTDRLLIVCSESRFGTVSKSS